MPLDASTVGLTGGSVRERLENRWLMNYAASVDDRNSVYLDTLAADPVPAHPAYISHLEWDAIVSLIEAMPMLTPDEHLRGVHSFNDTIIHRALRAGDEVTSTATVIGVDRRRSGGRLTIEVVTVDQSDTALVTSYVSTIFRGVPVSGDDISATLPVVRETDWATDPVRSQTIEISSIAPHIFSECARDYNPIHTDAAVARSAGLPGIIMHGTGLFALAVSSLVTHESNGNPLRAERIRGRLRAMVLCPSVIELHVYPNRVARNEYRYTVTAPQGGHAIDEGFYSTRV